VSLQRKKKNYSDQQPITERQPFRGAELGRAHRQDTLQKKKNAFMETDLNQEKRNDWFCFLKNIQA